MTEIVCVCVRACMHACVRVYVCACVRVCVNIDVFLILLYYHDQDAKSSYNVMIDSHIVLLCRGTCLRRTPLKPTSHIQRYTTGMTD